MADNTVTLVGNITDDPELRFTPSGQAVASFTVAVNRRTRNQDGSWDDKLDGFFRCSCWREMAENVAESLQKGTRIVVTGRLQQRSWETEQGERRSVVEVQVDEVGPSLRWASAKVTKSQRSGGGFRPREGEQQGRPAGGWGTPEPGQGSGAGWGTTPEQGQGSGAGWDTAEPQSQVPSRQAGESGGGEWSQQPDPAGRGYQGSEEGSV